ncbi:glycosyl transferase family 2 [Edaphobacter aggregans]|jgi:glycosyltransferase involved in cell wall biosynthesis|uniref:Glycosyl transferase family 2 n=1 Tax=Edaphobacter aggregans TaxID=570835 RepID=A0A428MQC2_9BACT|nr:glycosyltransferase [Edaphobacter aggregans]RSL19078.1 glycosyl transferase family 2 [Edaphobacter aggregans]
MQIKHPAWHVAVLIPARNEELLIQRCLDSVLVARSLLPPLITSDLVVACDSSTDRTFELAAHILHSAGIVVRTRAAVVGHARALAARVALRRYAGPLQRCWLANTDADCCVPETWLLDQIGIADQGIDAIAGTISVDSFEEHPVGTAKRFQDSYIIHADGTHPHVHGANMGVRADTYLRAGGWRGLATAEDHDLWNRLMGKAVRQHSSSRVRVITSGRRRGRAPRGFANALVGCDEAASC